MELNKSSEMVFSEEKDITFGSKYSKARIVSLVVLAVGIIFLTAGIVLTVLALNEKNENDKKSRSSSTGQQEQKTTTFVPTRTSSSIPTTQGIPTTEPAPASSTPSTHVPTTGPAPPSRCDSSEEAKRVGLGEFLSRVKRTYYKLHPYEVYKDPDVTTETIKAEYVAYDPTPFVIKNRTDTSLALLKEINDKKIDMDALKPREKKALAQVKHYLQHIFGQPYDVNYYAGDWMMGPNYFCWQEICFHGYAVHNGLGIYHKPNSSSDVELIEKKLMTHKAGILQYIKNMKMGVRKGMVRSVEECEAGIYTIKRQYLNISLYNATGKVVLCSSNNL